MEHTVQIGARAFAVDYALRVNRKALVYVEAKGFGSSLWEDDGRQVRGFDRTTHFARSSVPSRTPSFELTKLGRTEAGVACTFVHDRVNPVRRTISIRLVQI